MRARKPPLARTAARRPRTAASRSLAALAVLGFLVGIAGCRSVTNLPLPNPSTVAEGDPNWFCGTGDENGEWACVRDQELRVGATPPVAAPRSEAAPAGTEGRAAPVDARNAPRNDTSSAAAAARRQPLPTAPRRAPAARRDGPVPLTEVPPDYYVLQLLALGSKEALEEYAARKAFRGLSAARVERGGALFYVLLFGMYRDRQSADAAAANLPPELAEFKPWVRRVESLQEAIRRGDALAGTSEI